MDYVCSNSLWEVCCEMWQNISATSPYPFVNLLANIPSNPDKKKGHCETHIERKKNMALQLTIVTLCLSFYLFHQIFKPFDLSPPWPVLKEMKLKHKIHSHSLPLSLTSLCPKNWRHTKGTAPIYSSESIPYSQNQEMGGLLLRLSILAVTFPIWYPFNLSFNKFLYTK